MALRINTNVASLNAHQKMIKTDNKMSESLGRLSTGLRINKAADDASGMAIADSLRAQANGLGQAIKNANDGISMVQTADGALEESINIINTIKTKAIQAASDGQTTDTRRAIQNDISKLMEELDAIAKTTSFNGQKLLSGAFTDKKIQIGAFANETASINIGSTQSTKTGHISRAQLELSSEQGGTVQLDITSSITGEVLNLNEVDIQFNNSAENGMGALADEVNRYSSVTGIKANAIVKSTTGSAISAGETGSEFAINGVKIGKVGVLANDSNGALTNGINSKTAETGVMATMNADGTMTLSSVDGRAIEVTGDVSDVMGSTSAQMSTIGYLDLTQAGVSQFQINGIGAGATGADFVIKSDVTTVKDSILTSGSTIKAGSKLAAGTVVGGDTYVESNVASTQLDTQLKSGSTIAMGSKLAKGTTISGQALVQGETRTGAITTYALQQDMLVAAGSQLAVGSTLGKGTVITTQFTQGGTTYNVGDTLTSELTLTSALTLQSDMVLKYDAGANSAVAAGSTLNAGSTMGVDINIGYTYDTTGTTTTISGTGGAISSDLYINAATAIGGTSGSLTIKAGSLLKNGSVLDIAETASYTGPTLVTNSGTIEAGDVISSATGVITVTLVGDQVISEDLTTSTDSDGGAESIAAGSILKSGSSINGTAGTSFANRGNNVTSANMVLADDMTLKATSTLAGQSVLLAGSELGNSTYVSGGVTGAGAAADITTYTRTDLKAGSTLEAGSTLAKGSTVGASTTLNAQTTLTDSMTLKAGSKLVYAAGAANNTFFKAGTVINQDLTLNTSHSGGGTEVQLKAGDVVTTDLYLDDNYAATGLTLSNDMTMTKDSKLAADSILAVNTENAGTVGLSDTQVLRLADIDVLTQEGAQLAIEIADAALKNFDEIRAGLGSTQNQLTSTVANLSVTMVNISASESAVRDVDFAEEASNFSKLNILAQSGAYALSQANSSSQIVMSLLQ